MLGLKSNHASNWGHSSETYHSGSLCIDLWSVLTSRIKSEGCDSCDGLVTLFNSDSIRFSCRMTFKFDEWPKKKTIWNLLYATSSFVHHFKDINEFKLESHAGNAKLRSILATFYHVCPWNFTDDLNNFFYATSGFVFVAIGEFRLVTVRKRPIWCMCFDLDLCLLTLTFCMNIYVVNGNNYWKFHDDMMKITLWKRCNRRTDR